MLTLGPGGPVGLSEGGDVISEWGRRGGAARRSRIVAAASAVLAAAGTLSLCAYPRLSGAECVPSSRAEARRVRVRRATQNASDDTPTHINTCSTMPLPARARRTLRFAPQAPGTQVGLDAHLHASSTKNTHEYCPSAANIVAMTTQPPPPAALLVRALLTGPRPT